MADFDPIHPGTVLHEDFLKPLGVTPYALARAIGVTPMRVSEIVKGRRAPSADTGLRLGRYFGTTPEFWSNLQSFFDLERARETLGPQLAAIRPRAAQRIGASMAYCLGQRRQTNALIVNMLTLIWQNQRPDPDPRSKPSRYGVSSFKR